MRQEVAAPRVKRQRRDIKACASCRRSKVKCDGQQPCQRCAASKEGRRSECIYAEVYKDPNEERLEQLESELRVLRNEVAILRDGPRAENSSRLEDRALVGTQDRSQLEVTEWPDVVARGLITDEQAARWFDMFFSGSNSDQSHQHVFVPIFSADDTYTSIATRSSTLFDAILSIGSRADEGPRSSNYQKLQRAVRERISHLIAGLELDERLQLETVQALVVLASYSENGWLLTSTAVRLALQLQLPGKLNDLILKISESKRGFKDKSFDIEQENQLFRVVRVWLGVFNLHFILSLDGENTPAVTHTNKLQGVRTLIHRDVTTFIDLRLVSQIELNMIRSKARTAIEKSWSRFEAVADDTLQLIVNETCLQLDVWQEEWRSIIHTNQRKYATLKDHATALLNLDVQYRWALITLHLKAVSNTGVDNIAAMTLFQQSMVTVAKNAAIAHLRLLLAASSNPPTSNPSSTEQAELNSQSRSTYFESFKWTMDFVWAKCAFSILLVFRLSLLLHEPAATLIDLVQDARTVLTELRRCSVGEVEYVHIVQVSIEKFERALRGWMEDRVVDIPGDSEVAVRPEEEEFERYAPREFVFEWNFPGLDLKHVPLGWADLFLEWDGVG